MAKRKGTITPNGVLVRPHELRTLVFLTENGFDVENIPPSKIQHKRTADIIMNGIEWEIKAPTRIGKNTLDHAMKSGLKQSDNLIFDLRNMHSTGERAATRLQKEFARTKKWRRLIIITKDSEKALTFEK